MDAHLLFKIATDNAIPVTKRAILVDYEFRYNEQRNAFDALRSTRNFCQYEVDDVIRHVMLARRDENLLAGNLVGTVSLRIRLGAHQTQIGAAMRLGQVHCAGPLACHHLGQKLYLKFVRCMGTDRLVGTVGQTLIHIECEVGGYMHLANGGAKYIRHALTAIFRITSQTCPAALADHIERFLEAVRRAHHAVFQLTAFGIAYHV